MMADVRRVLRLKPNLHVGVVQDGAPELWNLIRDEIRAVPAFKLWRAAVDMFHLFERLAKALEVVEPDPSARRAQLVTWKNEFFRDDYTIDRVIDFFNQRTPWLRGRWTEKQRSSSTASSAAT